LVAPLATYTRPIADLGANKSADGIIEYRSGAFGGALRGNLLITNYSVGDDITRIVLSGDGASVVSRSSIAGNFVDPLPVVEGPDGTLYVGEHGANRITALVPRDSTPLTGTWSTKAPMPVALLDAGGAVLDGKLYAVAGKTSAGPRRTLYVLDTTTNTWSVGPSLPTAYPAVENPAVVAYNGKLYVFGGSSASFSGAVGSAAVFEPGTGAWTMLPSMGTARGGATAQVLDGKIYLAGGLGADGASISRVSVFTPATSSWSSGPGLSTRRDNAGSAALNGTMYVFGGRTRNADGTTAAAALTSVEALVPQGTWQPKASMPTGRRTMAVGTIGGRAQVSGGEGSSSASGTSAAHEQYDPITNTWRTLTPIPTPRHGAVAGTAGTVTYVAGGGPTTGSSFSIVTEAFSLD
jgi:N-acetylneuraminic acid mutarotase